jgi:hypothetical protein
MLKHFRQEWLLLTRSQQQMIKDAAILLPIWMGIIVAPGAIDQLLTHLGI